VISSSGLHQQQQQQLTAGGRRWQALAGFTPEFSQCTAAQTSEPESAELRSLLSVDDWIHFPVQLPERHHAHHMLRHIGKAAVSAAVGGCAPAATAAAAAIRIRTAQRCQCRCCPLTETPLRKRLLTAANASLRTAEAVVLSSLE
jgi:hypothetical protein